MLKNIPVKINADKSISANYPYKIYQGEINTVRFIIDPSLVISDTTNVVGYIGFKRIDNQKSGFVSLKKEQDGTFTYVIKDYWTLNLVGKVWYTIKFVSVSGDNQLEYQLYAGNSSFVVNPVADYIIGDDLPPDISSTLQLQIEHLQEQINNTNLNIDNKLNKEFNTYPKLDWDTVENSDIVALNRVNPDGTVTQYYAEAEDLYNSVNNMKPDVNGNIELTGENINVSSTNNNTIDEELDLKVNRNEPLVYYKDISVPIQEPMISVYKSEIADKAIADENGNNIFSTYSTKNELTNVESNLNEDILNLNDTLSQDISDTQTQITNLSTSISQNYVTKNALDTILNNKATKSELVYTGVASSSGTNFQTMPSFNATRYIVEYESSLVNSKKGTCIISTGNYNTTNISNSDFIKLSNNEFSIYFYNLQISIGNNNVSSNVTFNELTYSENNYSISDTRTDSLYVKVYAIDI